ncbi:MAG: hypothetical protein ACJAZO_000557 [Myxococcota bacterium]|jgi:hypothetical protein
MLKMAQDAAEYALAEADVGVLRLRAVVEHDRRVAWVYEAFDGVALLNVAGDASETVVPASVAAELLAVLVEVLMRLPGARRHPGPEDWDVLVDDTGGVKLAGFVGPTPRSPRLFAPFGDVGDAALVYRLGVYLGTMLAGAPPGQAVDELAHAATVRRMLVRAMSRPNVGLPDGLGDVLRRMLSWDPDDRPRLQSLPKSLRDCLGPQHVGLEAWCSTHIGGVRRAVTHDATVQRNDVPASAVGFNDAGDDRTAVEDSTIVMTTDSRTAGQHHDRTQQTSWRAPDVGDRAGNSLFPVQVGPPPEILKKRPMLPDGFLHGEQPEPTVVELPAPTRPSLRPLVVGMTLALCLVGAMFALTAVLTSGPSLALEIREPSIGDALPAVESAGARFDVEVLVRGGKPFSVTCPGGSSAAGVDAVTLVDAAPGRCQLSGQLDGEHVVVAFDVYEASTVRCFQTRQARCR